MPERACALCRTHPVDPGWRPFCSERCQLLDLSKWIEGGYRVPGEPADVVNPDEGEEDDHGSDER